MKFKYKYSGLTAKIKHSPENKERSKVLSTAITSLWRHLKRAQNETEYVDLEPYTDLLKSKEYKTLKYDVAITLNHRHRFPRSLDTKHTDPYVTTEEDSTGKPYLELYVPAISQFIFDEDKLKDMSESTHYIQIALLSVIQNLFKDELLDVEIYEGMTMDLSLTKVELYTTGVTRYARVG